MSTTTTFDTVSIIAGSLALVASFAWRDAFTAGIDKWFPLPESNVRAKFIYAILITMFIFLIFNIFIYLSTVYTSYNAGDMVQKIGELFKPLPVKNPSNENMIPYYRLPKSHLPTNEFLAYYRK